MPRRDGARRLQCAPSAIWMSAMSALLRDPRALSLLVAASLTIMANATIAPALPGLEERFAADPNAALLVRMLITAPSLIVACTAPFMGMIVDRFGRRIALLLGVLLYALLGTAGLYLPDLRWILASRLALGIAVALIMTSQSALVGDYFAGETRGRLMGYQVSATNLGGLVFVSAAGWLAGVDPRAPFAIYALALLMLPLFWLVLHDVPRTGANGKADGRPAEATADWIPVLLLMATTAACTMAFFYTVPTQIPYHLVRLGFTDPAASGVVLATLMLSSAMTGVISGWLRPRLGQIGTSVLGYFLIAAGFSLFSLTSTLGGQSLGSALVGSGVGFTMPTFIMVSLEVAPAHRRGIVAGTITAAVFLGQFASPLLSQPLVEAFGFSRVFLMYAAFLVMISIFLMAFPLKAKSGARAPDGAPARQWRRRS